MSETERVKGTLTRLSPPPELSWEDQLLVLSKNYTIIEYDADWEDVISPDLMYLDNTWYKIEKEGIDTSDHISFSKHPHQEHYYFDCTWYNGGACLDEILEHELKECKKLEKG